MRVYHFLPSEWALSNVALKRMKISRISDLNDPFELQAVNLAGQKQFRVALAQLRAELSDLFGLLCFSKSWHNPVLWSHYASKHHGMCLGFDFSVLHAQSVAYSSKRIRAGSTNDTLRTTDASLVQKLLYTKYDHWKYEDEVRAFVQLDKGTLENGNYFYPFDTRLALREVILGPLCEVPVTSVSELVALYSKRVYVVKSRLAFREFRVVEDKRYESKGTA